MMTRHITIGTRGSALARWQTDYIAGRLREVWGDSLTIDIRVISTRGDEILGKALPAIGGKGLFTEALEEALRNGEIDIAVHSLKDLPTTPADGLTIGAIPERAPVSDVLISRDGLPLAELPHAAKIGTSSVRRAAQLQHYRRDFVIIDIRGNVDTRIGKVFDDAARYDAIVLAHAGVSRLNLAHRITETLDLDRMLPAPGQGALGVQCRDDADSLTLLAPIDHAPTRAAVTAERAFLSTLGGGCSVPVAALATHAERGLTLHGRVSAPDGTHQIDVTDEANDLSYDDTPHRLGVILAERALAQGASRFLESHHEE